MTEETAIEMPAAPEGAEFVFDEVRTAKGSESLGEVPILHWNSIQSAIDYYGEQALLDVFDGTSLRVSFQSIARRYKLAGKSNAEIAQAQIDFRPGKRGGGASTPESRAAKAARRASENVQNKDLITGLLEKIASGELSEADLASLMS